MENDKKKKPKTASFMMGNFFKEVNIVAYETKNKPKGLVFSWT